MATTPGPWTLVNQFLLKQTKGTYDLSATSTYKIALVTSASNISEASTTWAAVTGEVANANGYTTGGIAVTLTGVSTTASGTNTVTWPVTTNPVWTAVGGSITGARTAVLYKVGGDVLARCALDTTAGGSDVTALVGENITLDSDGTPSPVVTFATATA